MGQAGCFLGNFLFDQDKTGDTGAVLYPHFLEKLRGRSLKFFPGMTCSMRVLILYNPLLVARRPGHSFLPRLEAVLRAGWAAQAEQIEIAPTLSPGSASEQAAQAVATGFDTFLVCGGDGTVFQVLQGVVGKDVALGVVPLGTGNVIAQNLGLPRNPLRAAWMLAGATPREVTLGRLTVYPEGHENPRHWYFLIAAGMGMHASLMNLAAIGPGKRFAGRSAYFLGGARLLLLEPMERFSLEFTTTEGVTHHHEASEAIAVHVRALNLWQPGSDWFAPSLRLAWVPRTGRAGFFRSIVTALANRVAVGAPVERGHPAEVRPYYEDVVSVVCTPLATEPKASRLLVEADGEVLGARRMELTVAQERIRLLFPQI